MSRKTVILDRRFVPKDEIIMKEGEQGSIAFLVQSGEVRVYTTTDDHEVELACLGVGEIFGEMALISDNPRTASVQATQDCNLIVISRIQFEEKLGDLDPTISAVIRMLTRRITQTNNSLVNKKQTLKDLQQTTRLIYQNILSGLPTNQKRNCQELVLPAMEEFLESIEQFQDRYAISSKSE